MPLMTEIFDKWHRLIKLRNVEFTSILQFNRGVV